MTDNMNRNERLEKLIKENRRFGESLEEEIARLYLEAKVISKEDVDYLLSFNQGLDEEKLGNYINKKLEPIKALLNNRTLLDSQGRPTKTLEEIAFGLYKNNELDENTIQFLCDSGALNEEVMKEMMSMNKENNIKEEVNTNEHIEKIKENKDKISNAVYNSDFVTLADLYIKGILNDNDLKILSETSENKVDGVQTKNLYNEVKSIVEGYAKSQEQLANAQQMDNFRLEEPRVQIPVVGREIIENNEKDSYTQSLQPQMPQNSVDNTATIVEPTKVKNFEEEAKAYRRRKEELERKKQEELNNLNNSEMMVFLNSYVIPELESLKNENNTNKSSLLKEDEELIKNKLNDINSTLDENSNKIDELNQSVVSLRKEKNSLEKTIGGHYRKMAEISKIEDKEELRIKGEEEKALNESNIQKLSEVKEEIEKTSQMINSLEKNNEELEKEKIETTEKIEDLKIDHDREYRDERIRILTDLKTNIESTLKYGNTADLVKVYDNIKAKEENGEDLEALKELFREETMATKAVYDSLNEEELALIRRKTYLEENVINQEENDNLEIKNPKLEEIEQKIKSELKTLADLETDEEMYEAIANLYALVNEKKVIKEAKVESKENNNNDLKAEARKEIEQIDNKIEKITEIKKLVNYPQFHNEEYDDFNKEYNELIVPFAVKEFHDSNYYTEEKQKFDESHNITSEEAADRIFNIKYDETGKFARDEEVNVKNFMKDYNLTLEETYKYKDIILNQEAAYITEENSNFATLQKGAETGKVYRSQKKLIKDNFEDKDMIALLNIPLVDDEGKERESIPELRSLAEKYNISPYVLYSFAKSRSKKHVGPILVTEERTLGQKAKDILKKHWKKIVVGVVGIGVFIGALVKCNGDKDARDAAKEAMDADNAIKQEQEITADDGFSTGEEVNTIEVGGQTYGFGSGSYGTSNNVVHTNDGGGTIVDDEYDHSYDTPPIDETDPNQPTTPEDPGDPEEPEIDLPYLEEGGYWKLNDGLIGYDGTVIYTGSDGKTYTAKLTQDCYYYENGRMYLNTEVFEALTNNDASIEKTVNNGGMQIYDVVIKDDQEENTNDNTNTNNGQVNDNNSSNTTDTNENDSVQLTPSFPDTPGIGEDVYPATPIIPSEEENGNDNMQTPEGSYDPNLPDVGDAGLSSSEEEDAINSVLDELNKAQPDTSKPASITEETKATESNLSSIQSDLDKLKEERAKALEQQQVNETDAATMDTGMSR